MLELQGRRKRGRVFFTQDFFQVHNGGIGPDSMDCPDGGRVGGILKHFIVFGTHDCCEELLLLLLRAACSNSSSTSGSNGGAGGGGGDFCCTLHTHWGIGGCIKIKSKNRRAGKGSATVVL